MQTREHDHFNHRFAGQPVVAEWPQHTADGADRHEQAADRLRAVAARGHSEELRQRIRAATRC